MVTTDEDEPTPIGAVAAFGGHIHDLIDDTVEQVTVGHRRAIWPIILIALATVPVVWQPSMPLALMGVLALVGLAMWVVAEVMRD